MSAPSINTAVVALLIAAYAALVSTITGAVQLFNYRRDRARIRISVGYNMQIVGDPRYTGKTLTIVNVMNKGQRPTTISSIGAWRLHPHNPFVIPDTNPALPHELTEGKNVRAILPPCDVDFTTIDRWEACDAAGQTYKLVVAPWYARALSNAKWRLQWRRKTKKSESAKAALSD